MLLIKVLLDAPHRCHSGTAAPLLAALARQFSAAQRTPLALARPLRRAVASVCVIMQMISVLWFLTYFVLVVDNYWDCQLTGVDNLCYYGLLLPMTSRFRRHTKPRGFRCRALLRAARRSVLSRTRAFPRRRRRLELALCCVVQHG